MWFPEYQTKKVTLQLTETTCGQCIEYVSYSVSIGSQIDSETQNLQQGSNSQTFNFGTVTNNANQLDNAGDTIAVTVTYTLKDNPGSYENRQLSLLAQVGGGGTLSFSHNRYLYLRVALFPHLQHVFASSTTAPLDAGDWVTHTLYTTNPSGGNSAFDLELLHSVSPNFSLDAASVKYKVDASPWTSVPPSPQVAVSLARLAAGAVLTVEFNVQALQSVPASRAWNQAFKVVCDTYPLEAPSQVCLVCIL